MPELVMAQDAGAEQKFNTMSDEERAYYLHMAEKEPYITQCLETAVYEACPEAEFNGLEYRLKTASSLYNKLHERGEEQELKDQNDTVRYTIFLPGDKMVDSYFQVMNALEQKGFVVKVVKNYWTKPKDSGYRGLNLTLLYDNAQIEIQIHTPESYEAKSKSHAVYEEMRVLDPSSEEYKNYDVGAFPVPYMNKFSGIALCFRSPRRCTFYEQ